MTRESFDDVSPTQPLLASDTSESDLDKSSPTDSAVRIHKPEDDSSWQIALQVFFPYMVAGLGMVGAGVVLDVVQVCVMQLSLVCYSITDVCCCSKEITHRIIHSGWIFLWCYDST